MPDYSKYSKGQQESELRRLNSEKARLTNLLGKPGYSSAQSQLNMVESAIKILINLLSKK